MSSCKHCVIGQYSSSEGQSFCSPCLFQPSASKFAVNQTAAVALNAAQCTNHLMSTMSSSLLKALNGDDVSLDFESMCFFNVSSDPLQRLIGSASCRAHSNTAAGVDILGRSPDEVGVTSWDTHKEEADRLVMRIKNVEDMIQRIDNAEYSARITTTAVEGQAQATRALVIETAAQTSAEISGQLSNELSSLRADMQAGFDNVAALTR
jgi:hypothetical protein